MKNRLLPQIGSRFYVMGILTSPRIASLAMACCNKPIPSKQRWHKQNNLLLMGLTSSIWVPNQPARAPRR